VAGMGAMHHGLWAGGILFLFTRKITGSDELEVVVETGRLRIQAQVKYIAAQLAQLTLVKVPFPLTAS
jgi:hypothetical protein